MAKFFPNAIPVEGFFQDPETAKIKDLKSGQCFVRFVPNCPPSNTLHMIPILCTKADQLVGNGEVVNNMNENMRLVYDVTHNMLIFIPENETVHIAELDLNHPIRWTVKQKKELVQINETA